MAPFAHNTGIRQRLLVIFPGALGDLICLVPALGAISRRHPGVSLELAARLELARFAVGRMGIAQGHSIDRREMSHLFIEGGSPEARAFFGAFNHIYSFFADDDPCFKRSLAAIAKSVSFMPFRPPGTRHAAECYLRALGEMAESELEARIGLLDQDRQSASRELARIELVPGDYLLVLPGSGSPKKNWPAENFAELAHRVAPRGRSLVVLGPAEAALEPYFMARGFAVLSNPDLGEVAGIAHFARAFVGNDSGVSHLASAAGARGIVLFGPTDPARWRPLGQVEVIRREPLDRLTVGEAAARLQPLLTNGRHDG